MRKTNLAVYLAGIALAVGCGDKTTQEQPISEKQLINDGWSFFRYADDQTPDNLIYDVRPEIADTNDDKPADSQPTEAIKIEATQQVLKAWILPCGNRFIKDASKHYARPEGNPGSDFPFVQHKFDDKHWQQISLPHDWAINGPFYEGDDAIVGGGMGRLPIHGVAWYRKKLDISNTDKGKKIYLDVDGAMSYAMVWLNGNLVGGWPYGYASWRLDLTPYINLGGDNQLAIRVDNPLHSSRWYPGAGIYRNVWLVKNNPIHIAQWGTSVTTSNVSQVSADIHLSVDIENNSSKEANLEVITSFYLLDEQGTKIGKPVARTANLQSSVGASAIETIESTIRLENPKLWGPKPTQTPHLYVAVTHVKNGSKIVDVKETTFGIRDLVFDGQRGFLVNGEKIELKGVNQHHDLGALGTAFNTRAAERQLEMLQEAGCNAFRSAHNPPATELLQLTDRMGILVVNEIFDVWERKKTPHDSHLLFPEWHEQDLRALIRRDRNHPSIIMWSFGNEVGEQYTGEEGAKLTKHLYDIAKEEDNTRPLTVSMNYAKADMPMPAVIDVISLNYQGEGIRYDGAYKGLKGITTPPSFPSFQKMFPNKLIVSSENSAAVSSRGEYMFPVFAGNSAPVRDNMGGNSKTNHVSAYELHSVDFGSSTDKVFATREQHPYTAGGFVWSGWDYIGEPTPYYSSRSSYFGFIDLAGFKKDRFYLYQSQWRPELPMVHILPHWNWEDRMNEVTPVHVFTSGDEAELFVNGKSQGRKKKKQYEYRLRWDHIKYTPGELKVIAYKEGKVWAENSVKTTSGATKLDLTPDRSLIEADGADLSFITVRIADKDNLTEPRAKNLIEFSIEGPGEIVATDNGDPTDFTRFSSHKRHAFNGLCLVIIKAKKGEKGTIRLKAVSDGLLEGVTTISTNQLN